MKLLVSPEYDVNAIGAHEGGGEYAMLEDFGWTSCGFLRLLELFPTAVSQVFWLAQF